MLSIVPEFKFADHKAELIFVIDQSGSMDGAGIRQAKNALLVNLLRYLRRFINFSSFISLIQPSLAVPPFIAC